MAIGRTAWRRVSDASSEPEWEGGGSGRDPQREAQSSSRTADALIAALSAGRQQAPPPLRTCALASPTASISHTLTLPVPLLCGEE